MSDLAKAGLSHVVDIIDDVSATALVAVDATVHSSKLTAEAIVDALGDTLESSVQRVEALRVAYISELRRVTDAVANAVPTP